MIKIEDDAVIKNITLKELEYYSNSYIIRVNEEIIFSSKNIEEIIEKFIKETISRSEISFAITKIELLKVPEKDKILL